MMIWNNKTYGEEKAKRILKYIWGNGNGGGGMLFPGGVTRCASRSAPLCPVGGAPMRRCRRRLWWCHPSDFRDSLGPICAAGWRRANREPNRSNAAKWKATVGAKDACDAREARRLCYRHVPLVVTLGFHSARRLLPGLPAQPAEFSSQSQPAAKKKTGPRLHKSIINDFKPRKGRYYEFIPRKTHLLPTHVVVLNISYIDLLLSNTPKSSLHQTNPVSPFLSKRFGKLSLFWVSIGRISICSSGSGRFNLSPSEVVRFRLVL